MWIDQEGFKVMFSTFCIFIFECPSKDMKIFFHFIFIRGSSTATLRSVYQFWRNLIWLHKFKKGRKRKANVLHKNKKLPSVTLLSKLRIESEHINTAS